MTQTNRITARRATVCWLFVWVDKSDSLLQYDQTQHAECFYRCSSTAFHVFFFFLWYFSAEVCTGSRVTFTKGPNWALHIHLWGGPRQHSSTHQFTRSTEERRPKAVLCFPDVSRYGHIVILASPEVPVSWATEKNHFRIMLFFRRLLVGHKNHDRTTFHRKQCASNFPSLLSMWAWLIA